MGCVYHPRWVMFLSVNERCHLELENAFPAENEVSAEVQSEVENVFK